MPRHSNALIVLGLGLALLVIACGGDKAEPKPAATAATAATAAKGEGELCEEHGVLEAICTKCHPKLIPVFQAKGDWCEEHGFPESVCPICHPEKGGRPAGKVSTDDAPADGTKIRLKEAETARLAGIETVKAMEQPGGARLEVVAMIGYDATRRAEINARAVGVVRTLHVDIGDTVQKGARLATIESAAVGEDRSRLQAADARVKAAQAGYDREKGLYDKGLSSAKQVAVAEQDLAVARRDEHREERRTRRRERPRTRGRGERGRAPSRRSRGVDPRRRPSRPIVRRPRRQGAGGDLSQATRAVSAGADHAEPASTLIS